MIKSLIKSAREPGARWYLVIFLVAVVGLGVCGISLFKSITGITRQIREEITLTTLEYDPIRRQRQHERQAKLSELGWITILGFSSSMFVLLLIYLVTLRESERRRIAEKQAEERNKQLELMYREMESFSYSVSHDLKTPLRAISGFASILSQNTKDLNAEDQHSLDIIRKEVNRMGELIDALLDLAKVDFRCREKTAVDTMALVQDILSEVLSEKTCHFEVEHLPVVQAEEILLRQVFANLIDNAVKFSQTKREPRVKIGWHNRDEPVFYVRDNGVGFDEQYAKRLFGAFQRLHDAKEFKGVGIGLALVKRIITRHGGRVWAESKPGEGATFYFTLGNSTSD